MQHQKPQKLRIQNVICAMQCDEMHRQRLQRIFAPASIEFISKTEAKMPQSAMAKADIALWHRPIDPTRFCAPKLKWVHIDCSGIEPIASEDVISAPFAVTSAAGRSSPVLAEHALFLMLSICYRAESLLMAKWLGRWGIKEGSARRGLFGRSVLIIGLGHTGQALAMRCLAMGMKVAAFRRKDIPVQGVQIYSAANADTLEALLPNVDFIVMASSLNDTSHNILNAQRIALVKKGGIIVNVARGALVDELEIAKKVRSGHLAGYGSDVFAREPLRRLHPFRRIANTYISPHETPQVPDRMLRSLDIIEENYERLMSGRKLINRLALEDRYTFERQS